MWFEEEEANYIIMQIYRNTATYNAHIIKIIKLGGVSSACYHQDEPSEARRGGGGWHTRGS